MLKNKKAQIFTIISIAIIILFFVSYEIYSIVQERQAIKVRIKTMDTYLFSLEQDLERKAYISGFRVIFLTEDYIVKSGKYIEDLSSIFEEAVLQGKFMGQPSEIMSGATIPDIQNSILENSEKMNIQVSLSNIQVSIGQEDPWNIIVYLNATLNMTDKSNLASWNKEEKIKALVSIEGFEDPLFLLNTAGKISRKIYKTGYEGNYTSSGNVTNLYSHLQKEYYAENKEAPSFIKRLEGSNKADENGIESFVYIPELSAQGLQVYEKSVVDHIYFSSSNPTISSVSGMPYWFRLDSQHCSKYQLTC